MPHYPSRHRPTGKPNALAAPDVARHLPPQFPAYANGEGGGVLQGCSTLAAASCLSAAGLAEADELGLIQGGDYVVCWPTKPL